ncbi:MAG: hypothetical protein ACYC6L_08495 [Anaerolineae bacterium]
MSEQVRVSYDQGRAVVELADRTILVERRDTVNRSESCPLEWLSVALGS